MQGIWEFALGQIETDTGRAIFTRKVGCTVFISFLILIGLFDEADENGKRQKYMGKAFFTHLRGLLIGWLFRK